MEAEYITYYLPRIKNKLKCHIEPDRKNVSMRISRREKIRKRKSNEFPQKLKLTYTYVKI